MDSFVNYILLATFFYLARFPFNIVTVVINIGPM